MNDIVDAARKQIYAILGLTVVWFLLETSVREQLVILNGSEDALLWVSMRDAIRSASAADEAETFSSAAIGETITSYETTVPVQSGGEVPSRVDIVLQPSWLPGTSWPVVLTRRESPEGSYLFEISLDAPVEYRDEYDALFLDQSAFVAPRDRVKFVTLRDLHNLARRDGQAIPRLGNELYPILKARGWKGRTFEELTPDTAELHDMLKTARELRYSISGFSVSLQSLPIVFGMLYVLGGLLILGPVVRLSAVEEPERYTGSWVFAVFYPGPVGRGLMALQTLGLVGVSLIPLYYTISLNAAEALFSSISSSTLLISELTSVWAGGVMLCFVGLLIRRRLAAA